MAIATKHPPGSLEWCEEQMQMDKYKAMQKYEQEARAMQQAAVAGYRPTSIQASQWTGYSSSPTVVISGTGSAMGIPGGIVAQAINTTGYISYPGPTVTIEDPLQHAERIVELEKLLAEKDEIIEALSSMVEEIDDLRQENAELRIADAMKPEPDATPEIIWPEPSPPPQPGEWIEWSPPDGYDGPGPVESGVLVHVKLRSEEYGDEGGSAVSDRWWWGRTEDSSGDGEIVAYKVA